MQIPKASPTEVLERSEIQRSHVDQCPGSDRSASKVEVASAGSGIPGPCRGRSRDRRTGRRRIRCSGTRRCRRGSPSSPRGRTAPPQRSPRIRGWTRSRPPMPILSKTTTEIKPTRHQQSNSVQEKIRYAGLGFSASLLVTVDREATRRSRRGIRRTMTLYPHAIGLDQDRSV